MNRTQVSEVLSSLHSHKRVKERDATRWQLARYVSKGVECCTAGTRYVSKDDEEAVGCCTDEKS